MARCRRTGQWSRRRRAGATQSGDDTSGIRRGCVAAPRDVLIAACMMRSFSPEDSRRQLLVDVEHCKGKAGDLGGIAQRLNVHFRIEAHKRVVR